MNLRRETEDILHKYGKVTGDIVHIGSVDGKYSIDWETFCKLADNQYNNQTKKYRVAYDLVIVFKDGSYLDRVHDSFFEQWRYNQYPKRGNTKSRKIKNLMGEDCTLEQLYLHHQK